MSVLAQNSYSNSAICRPRASLFARLLQTVETWQKRHQSRRELLQVEAHMLDDMGIDWVDAQREARKPFWRD